MAGTDNSYAADPPPETLHELYEHAPRGYLTTHTDGVIVGVNATLLGLLGETRDTLLGRPIEAILTPGARLYYETHCAPVQRLWANIPDVAG